MKFASVVLLSVVASCSAMPVMAKECFSTDAVNVVVKGQGGDKVFSGLTGDQSHVLEIWVMPDGGWLATVTTPDKQTCIANGGGHYIGPLPNA